MGWGKSCIRFWVWLDQNFDCHGNQNLPLTYNGENGVSTFSQSFFIRSSPDLQVSKTGVKSQMSSSSRIGSFTSVLHALSHWKNFSWTIMGKWCLHTTMFIIDWIFVKLAGNQDRHKISVEFKFWSDQTSHFEVICPWWLKKAVDDIVQGIVLSFFIGSLLIFQITWAGIKSHKSSKFGQSGPFPLELPALIAEKAIFDRLGMLNSGERSLLFGRLIWG